MSELPSVEGGGCLLISALLIPICMRQCVPLQAAVQTAHIHSGGKQRGGRRQTRRFEGGWWGGYQLVCCCCLNEERWDEEEEEEERKCPNMELESKILFMKEKDSEC